MKSPLSFLAKITAIAAIASLVACGGGGGGDTPPATSAKLSGVTLVDASKEPLVGAEVTLSDSQTSSKPTLTLLGAASVNTPYVTDANGKIVLPEGLPPGVYIAIVKKNGVTSQINLKVDAENDAEEIKVMAPLASNDGGMTYTNIAGSAIIASISGQVSNASGPIIGAEVAISGGIATNGAVAVAQTDSDGLYTLLINVNKDLAAAMLNSTLTASANGHNSHTITGYQLLDGNATTGLNFLLSTAIPTDVLWEESFESTSATVNDWAWSYYGDSLNNGWHIHTAGENITNQALYDPASQTGYVLLAPDDTSGGKIPDPAGGNQCFWYGNASTADGIEAQGNYLDVFDLAYASTLDGGTSGTLSTTYYENYGFLYSPVIDLSDVTPTTPVSLTFKTWWEIESTNPNADGYDRMTVEVTTDGTTWIPLARLNPISDPQDTVVRSPIPFSNMGYNSAPSWIQQEAIPLYGVQGQTIQLRFYFDTWDDNYNGFRGWLIDDIMVQAKEGTFPLLDPLTGNIIIPDAESYVIGNYDPLTYEQFVTPRAYDSSTGLTVPLIAGSNTSFTAEVTYLNAGDATQIGLVFWGADPQTGDYSQLGDVFALIPSSAMTVEEVLMLSGNTIVPQSGDGYLDLWVEMYDANGTLIADYPLEFYTVQ